MPEPALKNPTDFRGKPFAPGQTIVRPMMLGAHPTLEERKVLAVEGEDVILEPGYCQTRPGYLMRPERACIVSE